MYCWSCGEEIPEEEGATPCRSCGTPSVSALYLADGPVPRPAPAEAPLDRPPAPPSRPPGRAHGVRMCPSCGYVGDGIPYFHRAAAAARTVGLGLVTLGFGSYLLWRLKRSSVVCPSCGTPWARARAMRGLPVRSSGTVPALRLPLLAPTTRGLPRDGLVRRTVGIAVVLLSFGFLGIGIIQAELRVVVFGVLTGLLGGWAFASGWQALQRRRVCLLGSLQVGALRVAEAREGRLTATDLASDLDLSLPAAERVLFSMEDRVRVRSEFTDEGILVFEFPEILLRSLSEEDTYPDRQWMEE